VVDAEGARRLCIRNGVISRYRQKMSVRRSIKARSLLTSGSRRSERGDSDDDDGLQELHVGVGIVGEGVEVLGGPDLRPRLLWRPLQVLRGHGSLFASDH
jgi:hypothetical protein